MLPPIEELPDPLAELLSVWEALPRSGGDLPRRVDFDPMSVPRLLQNVYLIAVEGRAPRRFRFRLIGEALLAAGAPGRPGMYVNEIPRTTTGAHLHEHLAAAAASRKPNWYRGPPTLQHHKFVTELEGIMLPLAGADDDVEALLGITVYRWLDGRTT